MLKSDTVNRSVRLFMTPWTVPRQAPLCPWASPGKNIGVGCHFLSQWLEAGATSGQTRWWIQMVVTYAPVARDLSGVISGEAGIFS